ncbi:hypothetical protein Enr13x_00940 [Stieleria neptunia]|uniref:Uncharacterized protein n=1 Tax=Stieleria neptunia TaxID=2527979 RepID=A0A518HHH2_9BACT|nr:hypothetical protein Enr13x_00940 [Stieleria neptunia]
MPESRNPETIRRIESGKEVRNRRCIGFSLVPGLRLGTHCLGGSRLPSVNRVWQSHTVHSFQGGALERVGEAATYARVFAGSEVFVSRQFFGTIRRAPRANVRYDHAQERNTKVRLRNPFK